MKWIAARRRVMRQRVLSAKEGRCLVIWEHYSQLFLEYTKMEVAG